MYPDEVSRDRGFRFCSPRSLRKQQEQPRSQERQNTDELSDAETEPYRVYHPRPSKRRSAKVSPSESGPDKKLRVGDSMWTKGEVCNWRRNVPQGAEPEASRCNDEEGV
ncbi:hypothetical protein CC1G_14916 [Coprinopsis cinerea okayama7|uniref:Uncharacterized protein n=1 Tax=Coprinopsis cinerea (strain Okayama-7 / 130 / ATCC MYA-4618 / FGSC 9003) TaxID=240176 RepID=D6RNS8_COPC7|nr:hypothetical protein CC1G_14916 [Coprinopsis cinerea okayama7\|eukprot:XP_002910938.1 hypothetical protein CC1G_14916 [Coprinopsis cinerea okayama7\